MGESQLKRLKASLRTAGITGPQKSKKPSVRAKQQAAAAGSSTKRLDRNVALQSIREEFNPFEIKTTREKHSISGRGQIKGAKGRPGLSKQIGEENVCGPWLSVSGELESGIGDWELGIGNWG